MRSSWQINHQEIPLTVEHHPLRGGTYTLTMQSAQGDVNEIRTLRYQCKSRGGANESSAKL